MPDTQPGQSLTVIAVDVYGPGLKKSHVALGDIAFSQSSPWLARSSTISVTLEGVTRRGHTAPEETDGIRFSVSPGPVFSKQIVVRFDGSQIREIVAAIAGVDKSPEAILTVLEPLLTFVTGFRAR